MLQQVPTNYDTDLFTPIHARMRELLGHDPDAFENERFSYQVIADHSRAVTFLIADDVLPANEGRGYVLRRILRRAVRHGRLLGRREPFMAETATVVIDVMAEAYPYLVERRDEILARDRARGGAVRADARRRARSCSTRRSARWRDAGARRRAPAGGPAADAPVLAGDVAFRLHDTYGFPIDLTVELAAEYGVARRPRGLRGRPRRAARRSSRSGKKAELAEHAELTSLYGAIQGRAGDTDVPRLRDDDGRGPGRRDRPRRAWSSTS